MVLCWKRRDTTPGKRLLHSRDHPDIWKTYKKRERRSRSKSVSRVSPADCDTCSNHPTPGTETPPIADTAGVPGYCPDRGVARFHCPSTQARSEEHTSELQSRLHLVCRLLLEKKKN